jgi:uncharacterized protein
MTGRSSMSRAEIGSLGGRARAEKHSHEELSKFAQEAARTRGTESLSAAGREGGKRSHGGGRRKRSNDSK